MSIDFRANWAVCATTGGQVVECELGVSRREFSPPLPHAPESHVLPGISAQAMAEHGEGQIVGGRIVQRVSAKKAAPSTM